MKKILSMILLNLLLAACATQHPPELAANLETSEFLNPNVYNQASPVVLTFYQLKSDTAFQQVNFFALYDNAAKTLGADLLDKYEVELPPKHTQKIHFTLSPSANYIGVVAAFREPDHAQWRQIIPVTPSEDIELQATVGAQSLNVVKQ